MTYQPSAKAFSGTGSVTSSFDTPVVLGCHCAACAQADAASGGSSSGFVAGPHVTTDAKAGDNAVRSYALLERSTTSDGFLAFTGNRNIDAVLIGSKIAVTDLTYTFPTNYKDYGENYDSGQSNELLPFNELQQAAARDAFRMVASYTNLTFREVSEAEAAVERPTFRLAQTTSDNVPSAMGNFPDSADNPIGQNPSGDIWFGRTQQPYYTNPEKGNWGYVTVLHEIGHTLGLKHGGDDYTGFDLSGIFGADGPLNGTRSLEWEKDGQLWSVMTYSTAPGTRNAYNGDEKNQATSYMMYDIAALQYMYGANFNTNAGDTVYSWNPATGENFLNGVGQGAPTGNKVLETIWDGGGNDTYDMSNYGGGVSVDLRPGATSVLSQAQLPNAEAYLGFNAPMQGSVGNALLYNGDTRSLIENAIGGSGDDRLTGNLLVGNGGNDLFDGMAGSDTIVGGDGSDTVSFSSATTGIAVTLNDGAADIRVANGVDTDILRSIENIAATAFDDVLVGDTGDNMLAGGTGGNDLLIGLDGNDRLIGGGFNLKQVDLPDVVKGRTRINDTLAAAVALDGSFDLAPRYGVTNADTVPHATVLGTVAKAGFEFYAFTGKAGATVTLDIDDADASLYSGVLLRNAAGATVAANFAGLVRDQGSQYASDPLLTFVLPTDGVYYAVVTNSVNSGGTTIPTNLPVGYTYTLNVSVEGAAVPTPTLIDTATALLDGGAGDDLLVGTVGNDTIIGGSGNDTVSFEQAFRGVSVDLGIAAAQDTGAGVDRIGEVENLVGSRQADRLVGGDGNNVIDGFVGQDTLIGGLGTDTLSFARQTRAIAYDLAGQDSLQVIRLGERVQASGFENLTGSAFADTLSGDAGANVISGGEGNDRLLGDSLGRVGAQDTLIGGAGSDTASFASYAAGITAILSSGAGTATAGATTIADLREIENLEGGSGADTLTGDAGANVLTGGGGADSLTGAGGDDVLNGGSGDDLLAGGDGSDTAVYAGATNTTVDLRLATAQDTGQGRDTLTGIENLRLGSGTNAIVGSAADNRFFDGGGNDTIDGGDGVDTVDYSAAAARVTASLAIATAQVTGAGSDTLKGIENLIGGGFGNRFTGSTGGNLLQGGAGIDTLIGSAGQDVLIGGDGNDLLVGDDLAGTDLSNDDRADYIDGGAGYDSIVGGQGNDTLLGGTGNDVIYSGSRQVTLSTNTFGIGDGTLDGGNDVIDGGDGVDTAYLVYGGRKEFVSVDLSQSRALNTVYSNGVAAGSVTNIERVLFYGGDAGNNVVGTAGYDGLFGANGNDTLIGGAGDDNLTGADGDDYLDGGEGYDVLNFSSYVTINNGINVDLRITGPQNTGAGMDTILNVEQIVATRFSDRIVGGDENLTVIDSLGGDDTYIGNGGNDTLSVIRFASYATASTIVLDGGDGNDTVNFLGGLLPDRNTADSQLPNRDTVTALGGAGNDTMTIRGVKSAVIDAGSGNDTVGISIAGNTDRTAYDITLGSGQDELAIQWGNRDIASFDRTSIIARDFQAGAGGDLLGLTAIVGQGLVNASGAALSLGTFSPFLSGHVTLVKQGNDTLLQADKDGRVGNSPMVTVMTLQNTDAFKFVLGNVYAYILVGTAQQTVFYDPIITQYMAAGQTELYGHAGRDSLQGAAGNDLLVGLAGDDFLNSFAGNDTLMGGAGVDYMVGGTGDDVYFVDNVGDSTIEQVNEGTDTVVTSVNWTLGTRFENIESLGGGIRATGNTLANVLVGSTTGQETLVGLTGDDTYVVRHEATAIVEATDGGFDKVVVSARAYTLGAGVAVEMMEAATGSDAIDLTGNAFDQMLVGNAGVNVLDGAGGFDIVSYRNATAGVVIDGLAMRGTGGDAAGDTYRSIEAFEGSNFDDRIIAGNGGMWLYGRGGNDWLVSGAGDDNMVGGSGGDVFSFDTTAVSGKDRIIDWSAGDRVATSKMLRGADSNGFITLGSNALMLLDGTVRGDTAELVDQGGAVLKALGRVDGQWWYGFVSKGDANYTDGPVTEMASIGTLSGTTDHTGSHDMGSSAPTVDAFLTSPFYVYNAMGDGMANGVMLTA